MINTSKVIKITKDFYPEEGIFFEGKNKSTTLTKGTLQKLF